MFDAFLVQMFIFMHDAQAQKISECNFCIRFDYAGLKIL